METHTYKTTPESKFGKALNYAYKLREKLKFYSETGHPPLSNQIAENAIRPFTIPRKNFCFTTRPRALRRARIYTVDQAREKPRFDRAPRY